MLKLSWDLFIVVIFAVIIAYSFIIGKENTLKVIVGSYIAILAADGIGNLFKQYVLSSKQFVVFIKFFGVGSEDKSIIMIKVVVFIAAIVILAIRGGFEVKTGFAKSGVVGMILNLIFGALSAGLVVSTLLIYASGASFVAGNVNIANNTLAAAYTESNLVKMMIDNYNLWFALPAVSFVVMSLFNKSEEMTAA